MRKEIILKSITKRYIFDKLETIAIKYSSGAQLNQYDNAFNCHEREFQLCA